MRAVIVNEVGPVGGMALGEMPDPVAGAGEVLVRVAYCALNPLDIFVRSGAMTWGVPPAPFVTGTEFSGTVEAVGEGVDTTLRGKRVSVFATYGGCGELAVAKATNIRPLPDGIDDQLGATYLTTAATAWHAVNTVGRIEPGQVVLAHSAAGPVGIMVTQIAKGRGATVIGLVGSAGKKAFAEGFGADHIIDTSADEDWPKAMRAALGGRGADLIVDGVQGEGAVKNFGAIAPLGHILYLGAAAGPAPMVAIPQLIGQSCSVGGLVLYAAMAKTRGAEFAEIEAKLADGTWRLPIDQVIGLDEVGAAHEAFAARKLKGRTIVKVGA